MVYNFINQGDTCRLQPRSSAELLSSVSRNKTDSWQP